MENQNVEVVENSKKGLLKKVLPVVVGAIAGTGLVIWLKNRKNKQLDEVEISEDSVEESNEN